MTNLNIIYLQETFHEVGIELNILSEGEDLQRRFLI